MPFWSKGEREVKERVEPLNEAELAWLAANLAAARTALQEAGLSPDGEINAEALDELWALFRSELENPNEAINLVGLAFGQLLVDRFDLEWVTLSDEHGTEIAVRGPSDFTVFPTNFVAKRYESNDTGFLSPFVSEVARTLRRLS
jgi:Domain of unknown function (DUF3806)